METSLTFARLLFIIAYSTLMVISAIGNIIFLILLIRRKRNQRNKTNNQFSQSKFSCLLINLTIANLLVAFIILPIKIGFQFNVSATPGDSMCKLISVVEILGFYSENFILVCISIDRFYNIAKPHQFVKNNKRVKIMLITAWLGSILCSLPQMFILREESSPIFSSPKQCLNVGTFMSDVYPIVGLFMLYVLPLSIIIFAQTATFLELTRRTKDPIQRNLPINLNRSLASKAKIKMIRLSIAIVLVFVISWTPFFAINCWYWLNRESARQLNPHIKNVVFLFACTPTAVYPVLYGVLNLRWFLKRSK